MQTTQQQAPAGELLRAWRIRRGLSQLELALQSNVSARHLSFLETGRAKPSRRMVEQLCEQLDVPLRQRNDMLIAAGFAPRYSESALNSSQMRPLRDALDQLLKGHEPFPAVVVDNDWNMVASNSTIGILIEGVKPELLEAPANVLRIC